MILSEQQLINAVCSDMLIKEMKKRDNFRFENIPKIKWSKPKNE